MDAVISVRHIKVLSVILFFLVVACTYGPPQISMMVENVRAKPDSHVIAVAVNYRQFRAPTGLNTFPNGGVSKTLDAKAMIYFCDLDTLEIVKGADIPPPPGIATSFEPWILGWVDDNLYVKVTGRSGTSVEDFKNLTTVYYMISRDGLRSEVTNVPQGVTFQHNSGPLPQDAFVRVSHGSNEIRIMTEDLTEWRTLLRIDLSKSELVAVDQ